MKIAVNLFILMFLLVAQATAQDPRAPGASGTAAPKRSWMSRVLHPFGSSRQPQFKNPKLRGLNLRIQISPQPVKLAETRQLEIRVILANKGTQPVELDFPTDQRIEIYLINAANVVLTKWSDNHAFTDKPATVLINPDEHVEYVEPIATRDLTPNRVFIAEVFFPKYPELRVRQKFLTEP